MVSRQICNQVLNSSLNLQTRLDKGTKDKLEGWLFWAQHGVVSFHMASVYRAGSA